MSSPSTTQLPTDPTSSSSSSNFASNSSSSHLAASSSPLSPAAEEAHPQESQELTYFSSNPNQRSSISSMSSTGAAANRRPPGGRCYSRDELLHLKKSPLVAPPSAMPPRKEWFGEFNEQASKPKDHDGLTATRMRHRRDADTEDPTRPFDASRSLFRSGPPQPSAMGSFRHQSFRDRNSDIDKDTAALKFIAERYDREKLGPISPGLAGFTRGVKDRETAPHFNGKDATSRFNAKDREAETAAPRIGAVPNRRAEGGREPRKKGDEVSDWRKNADPTREPQPRDRDTKREPSRTRGEDDKRRRDRSRPPGEDEGRRWREDGPNKERKGRDPSRNGERESEVNGRHGKKKVEDEERERAEANRKRKEERDKETPAWFDEDATPASNGLKGFAASGGLDELQKWKLEKKAREEERAREEREAINAEFNEMEHRDQEPDSNADEHKTPRPAKVQVDWTSAPPPPQPLFQTAPAGQLQASISNSSGDAQGGLVGSNPLDALKAMMGVSKDDAPSLSGTNAPPGLNGTVFGSATSSPLSSNYSPAAVKAPGIASAINYDAVGKSGTSDFDPPPVSRHAFAQPRGITNPSPAPSDGNNKPFDSISAVNNGVANLNLGQSAGPAGLRTIQSAEPSHRTRNIGDVHGHGQIPGPGSKNSRDSSPSHVDAGMQFQTRQLPPHLLAMMSQGGGVNMNSLPGPGNLNPGPMNMSNNVLDSAPLFHLPASAGANAGPKDGSVNVLSVITPQSQQQQMMANMGGMGGMPTRAQNASPQQNLLARLGIIQQQQQERKPSPKIMDGAGIGVGAGGTDLRMPMPQQHYGSGPPSASSASAMSMGRGAYGSPVDDRFEPLSAVSGDGRFSINQAQQQQHQQQPGSSTSSNYGPSPVGGANPNLAHTLSAKGSRLAKFFDNSREDGMAPHGGPPGVNMGGMGMMGRHDMVTPPNQFDGDKGQGMSDLLALLQSQQPNRGNPGAQQQMYREEVALLRQRELAIQQQQQQLRDRQLEQMYNQNSDFFDRSGSFVANDLVPGLRPPIQRPERDLYNSDRLDDRLAYAAHGRVPGVPGGGYDQMMRNMGITPQPRGGANMNAANMYSGIGGAQGGGGGMPSHLAAEILQQQQQQQQQQQLRERERQRQLQQRQQEMERAQLMAMQSQGGGGGGHLSARSSSSSLSAQLGPRQNNLDQFNRAGRLGVNEIQAQQFGGYGGMSGPNAGGLGGMGLNGGGGGGFGMGNQINGFDAPMRQQHIGVQQQRQVPGMGFGVEPRYGQQGAQLHGAGGGMANQSQSELMALLLGNRGGQQ